MRPEEQNETTPKFRNIHDEAAVPEPKPEGADIRLILGAAAIFLCILVIGIRGYLVNSNLSARLDEQNKLLSEAKAEALLYGITTDEDGDLVLPEKKPEATDVAELDWDSVEQRNEKILEAFTSTLLNWNGTDSYNKARQKLLDEWAFAEDSQLMTSFMPEVEELEANLSLHAKPKKFVLSDDGKDLSYFLICTVRTTVDSGSHNGTVGITITIHEDGTISDVTARTL